jgi:hypothetical protein
LRSAWRAAERVAEAHAAIAGGGWQKVSIPLASFFDDNSVFPGDLLAKSKPVTRGSMKTGLPREQALV